MILEEIFDFISEVWESFIEGILYFFSFEWIGDGREFIGAMFENLSELSFLGLSFGILAVVASYSTKYLNLLGDSHLTLIGVMVQHMSPMNRVVWTIISYVGAFLAGYLVGNRFENT